jgi:single-strand DNA-binding protein
MSKSLNRVQLIGNLGKDPDYRSTSTGKGVCSFSIATSYSFKDRDGNWQEETDWHNVVLWEPLADVARQYLAKGRKVFIEGRLKTRSYDDQAGNKKWITEVVGQSMILLDSRGSNTTEARDTSESNESSSDHFAPDNDIEEDDVPF